MLTPCSIQNSTTSRKAFHRAPASWDEKSGLTEQQKADLGKYYYDARIALMKSGGSFPFLSRSEEFNLHVEVHLRRNRLDAPARSPNDEQEEAL